MIIIFVCVFYFQNVGKRVFSHFQRNTINIHSRAKLCLRSSLYEMNRRRMRLAAWWCFSHTNCLFLSTLSSYGVSFAVISLREYIGRYSEKAIEVHVRACTISEMLFRGNNGPRTHLGNGKKAVSVYHIPLAEDTGLLCSFQTTHVLAGIGTLKTKDT